MQSLICLGEMLARFGGGDGLAEECCPRLPRIFQPSRTPGFLHVGLRISDKFAPSVEPHKVIRANWFFCKRNSRTGRLDCGQLNLLDRSLWLNRSRYEGPRVSGNPGAVQGMPWYRPETKRIDESLSAFSQLIL